MKKILATGIFAFLSTYLLAQPYTFQASIQPAAAGAGVTVLVKTNAAVTGAVSGITITIAIPAAVGARPPISVDNSANPYISYVTADAIDQSIGGVSHYIYNVLGIGDVIPAGSTVNFAANTDVPVATVSFGGNPALTSLVKLVNLPDGGTDPNPNSFFGFSVLGNDRVFEPAIFYAIPGVSTAVNDGNGYAGTSYAQTVAAIALPVKFLGFSVLKKDNSALLDWVIENETALTKQYEILRSVNGVDFKKVGAVNARNDGSTGNTYHFTDNDLSGVRSGGAVYYRIQQVDKDGKSIFSPIRNVRLDGRMMAISVYPNPIKQFANVSMDLLEDSDVKMTIIDASGKQVQTIPMQLFKGLNVKKINMNTLPAGSYTMNINTGVERRTVNLVKVN